MEELITIRYMLNRIEGQIEVLNQRKEIERKARVLSDEDEANGKGYTFWRRTKELGYDKLGSASKQDIKDTLRLIRKISLELEKRIDKI